MASSRKMLYVFGLLAYCVGLALLTTNAASAVITEETRKTTTTIQPTTTDGEAQEGDHSSKSRVSSEGVESTVQSLRQKAEKMVAEERKTRVTLDSSTREQLCTARKSAIETKLNTYSQTATSHLDRLDSAYTKLDTYLTTTPIAGIDLASAKRAQEDAAAKVVALEKIVGDGTVDCTNLTDNAAWLTQVRTAANDARTTLKTYRTELKAVVAAVQQAKQASASSGSDETVTSTR